MPTVTWSESQPEVFAELIGFKSVSTGTITRGSGTVTAKTVRLETLSSQRVFQGEGGMTFRIDAYILAEYGAGFKVGDRFSIGGQLYEVIMVAPGMTDNESVYLQVRG